jgi:hypothetical protein
MAIYAMFYVCATRICSIFNSKENNFRRCKDGFCDFDSPVKNIEGFEKLRSPVKTFFFFTWKYIKFHYSFVLKKLSSFVKTFKTFELLEQRTVLLSKSRLFVTITVESKVKAKTFD